MRFLLALLILCTSVAAEAQDTAPRTKAISTLTRGVTIFGQRENALIDAVHDRSQDALERTLAPDFEMRLGSRPNSPVPRADWIAAALAAPAADAQVSELAVHDLGDRALASFRLSVSSGAPPIFVVDLWSRTDGDWKLAVRYASVPGGDERHVTGFAAPATIEKRAQ